MYLKIKTKVTQVSSERGNSKGNYKFQIPFDAEILYQKVLQSKKTNPKLYFHSSSEELSETTKKSGAQQYIKAVFHCCL